VKWAAIVAALLALGGASPGFVDPEGIALDSRGGLLVTDLHGRRVFRIDLAHRTKRPVARTPTAAIDVAVAKSGVTYVLGEQRLFRLSGSTLTQLPFELPLTFAIAPAPGGRLALANIGDSRIELLDVTTGERTPLAVPVRRAHGVAYASDGSLLVADTDAGRILRVTPAGTSVLARVRSPLAVAAGRDGSVYAVLVDLGQVAQISPNGRRRTIMRNLADPADVAVDAKGRVYVSEHDGARISMRGLDGKVRVLAR
jgi:sugar lactone lactonase YvrE